MHAPNINALWSAHLVEELYRLQVTYVGIAPGSRSGPLAVAAAAHPGLRTVVHFDERGLAFHALGWARATGRPAAIITTSGTAVANLLPAAAEAALDHVPLLLLTADRPPELRDTAANQTMNQVNVFGAFARWQFDLPCPDATVPLRMLLTAIDQAVARSVHPLPGPVHLNIMFREPLAPTPAAYPRARMLRPVAGWLRSGRPLTRYQHADHMEAGAPLPVELRASRRGVIVAGAMSDMEARSLVAVATRLGWPILPDVQSQLRLGATAPVVMPYADLLLYSSSWVADHRPDTVLLAGGRVTSKRLAALSSDNKVTTVRVSPFWERQDSAHTVSLHHVGSLRAWAVALEKEAAFRAADPGWLREWQQANHRTAHLLARAINARRSLSEPRVAWELTRLLPPAHALFAGNSLPIRLLDSFGCADGARIAVAANRGVSGIDGLLAAATGYATGRGQPITLLIGDLSLLHDLSSLALLRESAYPVIVVVLNNDGGGIFSFLPVAQAVDFDRTFAHPHGRSFRGVAAMFDLPYSRVADLSSFIRAYRLACRRNRSAIIEVASRRADTAREWRRIQRAISIG